MTAPAEAAVIVNWYERGEQRLTTALGRLTDEEFRSPSLLPGWTRTTLLAHLAGNADALVNLMTWARTGVETPMYPSPEARGAGIAERAALPPGQLRCEVLAAIARLAEAVLELPADAWHAAVRTAHGRTVPAVQVPWMRCRESWVHSADLDAGLGFADVPEDVLAALIDDVFRMWGARDQLPDIVVFAGDREWGTGALAVSGPMPAVTAWLTGRSDGTCLQAASPLPTLAAWL